MGEFSTVAAYGEALVAILSEIRGSLAVGPAGGESHSNGAARATIAAVDELLAWHVSCLREYLASLANAAPPGPTHGARPPRSSPEPRAGRYGEVESWRVYATQQALSIATEVYDALRGAALAGADPGTALVAARGIEEIRPLIARLDDLLPRLVAAEYEGGGGAC